MQTTADMNITFGLPLNNMFNFVILCLFIKYVISQIKLYLFLTK